MSFITNSKIDKIKTEEVLLNGYVVAIGSVSVSLDSNLKEDELTGETHQIITIEGLLETGYYIPDLDKIETNRYYIEGVNVHQERYGSLENKIIYSFSASMFQVKFQDERDQYYRVEKPKDTENE